MGKVEGKDLGNLSEKEADHLAGNSRRDFLEGERERSMRRKGEEYAEKTYAAYRLSCPRKFPAESRERCCICFSRKRRCAVFKNPVGTVTILGTDFL